MRDWLTSDEWVADQGDESEIRHHLSILYEYVERKRSRLSKK